MATYKRILLNGKEDVIETKDKSFISPDTQEIMAENEEEANAIIENHRKKYPDQGGDTIPYIRIDK